MAAMAPGARRLGGNPDYGGDRRLQEKTGVPTHQIDRPFSGPGNPVGLSAPYPCNCKTVTGTAILRPRSGWHPKAQLHCAKDAAHPRSCRARLGRSRRLFSGVGQRREFHGQACEVTTDAVS